MAEKSNTFKRELLFNGAGIGIGLLLCAFCFLGVEIFFRVKNGAPPPVDPRLLDTSAFVHAEPSAEKGKQRAETPPAEGDFKSAQNFSPDSVLGFWPSPEGTYLGFERKNGKILYDTVYTHDRYRRRVTVQGKKSGAAGHAIFTGGSFTYGEGLPDAETLPSQFAQDTQFKVYNYAFSGWGPAQNVLRLERRQNLAAEVPEKNGIMIYVWMFQHINRVVCSYSTWPYSLSFPAFAENASGGVSYRGFWGDAHPFTSRIYSWLHQSAAFRALDKDLPLLGERHFRLAAKILRRLKDDYRTVFPQGSFYVLVWPSANGDPVISALKQEGISVITLPSIVKRLGERAHIPGESHPSKFANQFIAADLAAALRLP